MAARSPAGGVGAAVMNKQASKYNEQEGEILLQWIKKVLGDSSMSTSGSKDNFIAQLKDGVRLCNLANKLEANAVSGVHAKANSSFQCMNNLELFLSFAKRQGVITQELFRAVDLVEARDLYSVCMTLNSLGRILAKQGKPHPGHVNATEILNIPSGDALRLH